jgi:hypothetical protein
VRDPTTRCLIRFGGPDVEPTIDLPGVGGDHGDRRQRRERDGDGGLPDAGGAYKNRG